MRIILAVAVLGVSLLLGGCSHSNQAAYANPRPSPLPQMSKASWVKPPQPPVRKLLDPTKASWVKPPQPPVRKLLEPTKASSVKPPPLPARKLPEPTKVSSLKPPPLPVRKPQQGLGLVGEEAAKFKAAQERAAKVGVENLTKKDIDGLSYEQIKELRGY
jgi:hypothetical protein